MLEIRDEFDIDFDHGLHGSASPVSTATGFVNGRWQFLPPQHPQLLVQISLRARHKKLFSRSQAGFTVTPILRFPDVSRPFHLQCDASLQ